MSMMRALLACVEELERLGGQRQVIQAAKDAVKACKAATSRGGKSAKKPKGRKPRPLPWEDILAERKRGRTWREIRNRLEAAGYPISTARLRRRLLMYLNEQQSPTA